MMTSAAEIPSSGCIWVGNAAAVIIDRHRSVGIKLDGHCGGVPGQGFVDGVVHHLIDHVMQARAVIGIADIHARALAHRIKALEDLDGGGIIIVSSILRRGSRCIGGLRSGHLVS
jgi:hypothetical protein